MSERGFFSASNDIKTLDGNIFSGFPWLTTHLLSVRGKTSVGEADVDWERAERGVEILHREHTICTK